MMYIIIIGAGTIGESLARITSERGHNVVVVEKDENKCIELMRRYDLLAVNGDASIKTTLEYAGALKADALISTTNDDAVNLLVILMGKELGIKSLVSLVSSPEHEIMFRRLGADVMQNPASAVAEYLYRLLQRPSIRDFMTVAQGKAEILEIVVCEKAPVVGETLETMRLPLNDALLVAVLRDNELIIPRGKTQIREGDRVVVFVLKEKTEEITQLFTG